MDQVRTGLIFTLGLLVPARALGCEARFAELQTLLVNARQRKGLVWRMLFKENRLRSGGQFRK